jgi:hypothetical protein
VARLSAELSAALLADDRAVLERLLDLLK